MRIELDLPDWVETDRRNLYILAGIEEVAHKKYGKDWYIKVARCSMCGKCCEKISCEHLTFVAEEHRCGFLIDRPFACCVGDNAEQDYCSIEWEKVK